VLNFFYGEAVAAIKTAIIAAWKSRFWEKSILGLFDKILITWKGGGPKKFLPSHHVSRHTCLSWL